jgi:hypothetical protein
LRHITLLMLTSWGRHSSACLLRTEKPPWVLVSEAVNVLQKECAVHFSGSCSSGSRLVSSLCWSSIFRKINQCLCMCLNILTRVKICRLTSASGCSIIWA